MKGKILSKIMMIVAFVICSTGLVTACSWQKDINISSIEIQEGTIPETILVGEFDSAGIKLIVYYEDNSSQEIDVSSAMIPNEYQNCLTTPGKYQIKILFKGCTTQLEITMVEESIYTVNFYNGNGLLVSSQQIKSGEGAVEPTSQLLNIPGFKLTGWDVDFSCIKKDTNVYAIYTAVENTITNKEIESKWEKTIEKHLTSDSVSVWDYTLIHSDTNQFIHSTNINYHYNENLQTASAQHIYRGNNSASTTIYNYHSDWYEVYFKSDSGEDDTYSYYDNYQSSGFGSNILEGMLSNKTGFDIFNISKDNLTISYKLCNNKIIYIVEEYRQSEYNGEIRFNELYTYRFTEDGLIGIDLWREDLLLNKIATGQVSIQYQFVAFNDTLIPEEVKNSFI